MTFPAIASITAGILVIMQVVLMLMVGLSRVKTRVGIGDGGDEALALKIRRHGNLAENAALFIAVLTLVELGGASQMAVMVIGGIFIVARLCHAIALSKTSGPHPLRPIGAVGTMVAQMAAAIMALWAGVNAL